MENIRGIALMTGGMAAFALGDLTLKLAAELVPLSQVVLTQALGGLVLFGLLAARTGETIFSRAYIARPVLIRNSGELVAVIGITTGLALSDLSTAAALMQIVPLLVMLAAVVFLGERVGWRRWVSVAVGFFGVLVILRPAGGIEPGHLWILFGVLGLTARDVATRRIDPSTSSVLLAVYTFGSMVPLALVWLVLAGGPVWPNAAATFYLAVMVTTVSVALFLVTSSLRQGDVSSVAPFRYTRLLFALFLGMVFLGERPDAFVYLGAAMVIGSGLYALLRERQAALR